MIINAPPNVTAQLAQTKKHEIHATATRDSAGLFIAIMRRICRALSRSQRWRNLFRCFRSRNSWRCVIKRINDCGNWGAPNCAPRVIGSYAARRVVVAVAVDCSTIASTNCFGSTPCALAVVNACAAISAAVIGAASSSVSVSLSSLSSSLLAF